MDANNEVVVDLMPGYSGGPGRSSYPRSSAA